MPVRSVGIILGIILTTIAILVACDNPPKPSEHESSASTSTASTSAPQPAPSSTIPVDVNGVVVGAPPISNEASKVFRDRCASCHGLNGKGDGPTSGILNPKPRDYGREDWQKSVTDDDIRKVIIGGGPAVHKSPLMPPSPDLANNKQTMDGLVAIIRGFGAK
jgi:hypothetical protein